MELFLDVLTLTLYLLNIRDFQKTRQQLAFVYVYLTIHIVCEIKHTLKLASQPIHFIFLCIILIYCFFFKTGPVCNPWANVTNSSRKY